MTGRAVGRIVGITLLAVTGAACAKGMLVGTVSGPGPATSVLNMTWESGLFGESGTLAATMPDGEQFKGTYQVVREGMARGNVPAAWTGEEPIQRQGEIDGTYWAAGADHLAFVRDFKDNAIGTLRGDRGSTMLCRFRLLDSAGGMGGGGTGTCQTSRGAKIAARF